MIKRWYRPAWALAVMGLGLAAFGAVIAGAHTLANGIGWALVAVGAVGLVGVWRPRIRWSPPP